MSIDNTEIKCVTCGHSVSHGHMANYYSGVLTYECQTKSGIRHLAYARHDGDYIYRHSAGPHDTRTLGAGGAGSVTIHGGNTGTYSPSNGPLTVRSSDGVAGNVLHVKMPDRVTAAKLNSIVASGVFKASANQAPEAESHLVVGIESELATALRSCEELNIELKAQHTMRSMLGDKLGELRTENNALLVENAKLRRSLEELERRVKTRK